MILEQSLTTSMKMDLHIRSNTIKDIEENTGNTFFNKKHGNIFLESSPKAKETKTKKTKQDIRLIKLKSFLLLLFVFYSKGNHQQNKKITYEMGDNIYKKN